MSKKIIEVKNLYFSYEHQKVLQDVNLTVNQGDFLGILGPNGSGKTTLIKLILGLLKPQQGSIRLFDKRVGRFDRSLIGYVSQKSTHFNRGFPATVAEVVTSGLYGKLGLFHRMKPFHSEKVNQVIDKVGLTHIKDHNIGKLSGGQQQRVFIARALVSNPKLLILDEPTVGVDVKSTEEFYQILTHLHQEMGYSLILITHDIGVVTTYVNKVACLNKRLYFHGNPGEFKLHQKEILSEMYGHDIHVIEHNH